MKLLTNSFFKSITFEKQILLKDFTQTMIWQSWIITLPDDELRGLFNVWKTFVVWQFPKKIISTVSSQMVCSHRLNQPHQGSCLSASSNPHTHNSVYSKQINNRINTGLCFVSSDEEIQKGIQVALLVLYLYQHQQSIWYTVINFVKAKTSFEMECLQWLENFFSISLVKSSLKLSSIT